MPSSTGRSGMSQVPTSSRDFFAVVNAIFRKQRSYTWCFTTKSFPSNLSQIAPAHIFCFWWDALKGTRETETQSTDVEEDCSDKAWIICWRPVILAPWKTLNSYLFNEDRDECTWVTVHYRQPFRPSVTPERWAVWWIGQWRATPEWGPVLLVTYTS